MTTTAPPHATVLAPLDEFVADLATRQAGGLRAVTVDEVIDALLDTRNRVVSSLDELGAR